MWIFDHSSCHAAMLDDALDVSKININPRGFNSCKYKIINISSGSFRRFLRFLETTRGRSVHSLNECSSCLHVRMLCIFCDYRTHFVLCKSCIRPLRCTLCQRVQHGVHTSFHFVKDVVARFYI